MNLQNIRLQNFRIHNDRDISLSSEVTVIIGDNGAGKTSVIEAIYLMLRGTPFRGNDKTLVRDNLSWYRVDLAVDDELTNRSVIYRDNKRQFTVEDKSSARLPTKYRYPIVLFEPDILRLFTGSPSRRRDYLDGLLSQIDDNYRRVLHRYERALQQRNSLLKQSATDAEIFAWNVALSEYGSFIIDHRQKLISRLAESINQTYQSIAQKDDTISINYSAVYSSNIRQKLINELEVNIIRDRALGSTSVGPHRHDLDISFNGEPATSVCSRGEVRTIILALKFIEAQIYQSATGKRPIILLDDVFSELDESRQKSLISSFRDNQIIITSTNMPRIDSDNYIVVNL